MAMDPIQAGEHYWQPSLKYLMYALEPIHVGAGAPSISGVDNPIHREEATGIPAVPGTGISGAIRSYCALQKGDPDHDDVVRYFGSANDVDGGKQGVLKFSDARVVFFPVPTVHGPVWVTEVDVLNECLGVRVSPLADACSARKLNSTFNVQLHGQGQINLGWVLTDLAEACDPGIAAPSGSRLAALLSRAVVVDPMLFKHLTNDHLEVRTSVAIAAETGAADPHKLFSYEALPRGTVLGFEVSALIRRGPGAPTPTLEAAKTLVEGTSDLLALWGIGGMVTRGFGRVELIAWGGC